MNLFCCIRVKFSSSDMFVLSLDKQLVYRESASALLSQLDSNLPVSLLVYYCHNLPDLICASHAAHESAYTS